MVTHGDPFHSNLGALNGKVPTFCTSESSFVEVMLVIFLLFCLITFSFGIANLILGSTSCIVVCEVSIFTLGEDCRRGTILLGLVDVEACELIRNYKLKEHTQLVHNQLQISNYNYNTANMHFT